jgi:hypothetical protein
MTPMRLAQVSDHLMREDKALSDAARRMNDRVITLRELAIERGHLCDSARRNSEEDEARLAAGVADVVTDDRVGELFLKGLACCGASGPQANLGAV